MEIIIILVLLKRFMRDLIVYVKLKHWQGYDKCFDIGYGIPLALVFQKCKQYTVLSSPVWPVSALLLLCRQKKCLPCRLFIWENFCILIEGGFCFRAPINTKLCRRNVSDTPFKWDRVKSESGTASENTTFKHYQYNKDTIKDNEK
jgi:hypothetical protein